MADSNPFLALFGNVQDLPSNKVPTSRNEFNDVAERVFRLTLRPKSTKLFYMKELADALHQDFFDQTALDQAVLDYLVGLKEPIVDYLFHCFERSLDPEAETLRKTIFSNFLLAFAQPELFPEQNLAEQLCELLSQQDEELVKKFLSNIGDIGELFEPVFAHLKSNLLKKHLILGNDNDLNAVLLLCSQNQIAKAIVNYSLLEETATGQKCEETLVGSLFHCSCITKDIQTSYEFFDRPSRLPPSVHAATEGNIWTALERITNKVYKIFYTLLKSSPEVHNLTRTWIGQVLRLNRARGQMWAQHDMDALTHCVGDGFMLNFSSVLLQLSRPFCSAQDAKSPERLTKIDATFCTAKTGDFHKETCFVTDQENRPSKSTPYNFSTELFFMTHRALELGAKSVHSQMVQMSQNFTRLQRAHQDAQQAGQTLVAEQIQERMDRMMSKYLSNKAVLLVPEWLKVHFDFILATSRWLSATAKSPSPLLSCIPEFFLSNVMDFVIFVNRFSPITLDQGKLDDLLTLVVVFMGSPSRLKNPHMRAAMAEMLDGLMPPDRTPPSPRTQLFLKHQYASEVVRCLLHVFASIEMTGQGVAFEQKFNYRRPMYAAMKFLWSIKLHRRQFKALATEAEASMESAQPPLFLQFVNLLINDAIYLLDEGLSYMAQLKEQQQERMTDASWPDAGSQRQQREATYQHITMLARFHNLMGKETIRVLEMTTSEIKSVFVHSAMVDRVASMLNYFLLHLVGPKKRDFKVKDFGDYEFDPAELVTCICQIYCHLSTADNFCRAVSQDGRSYSAQLFVLAEDVLSRIGRRGALVGDLRQVAQRVAELAVNLASDEDLIASAPEEFLDPIMSSIMTNPVMLPSSKVVVDRSTIARHLLSDQSDPFNRSPLTMEDVVPDDELKEKIHQWLAEAKAKKAEI